MLFLGDMRDKTNIGADQEMLIFIWRRFSFNVFVNGISHFRKGGVEDGQNGELSEFPLDMFSASLLH